MNKQNNVAVSLEQDQADWIEKKAINEDRSIAKILSRLIRQEMESEKSKGES